MAQMICEKAVIPRITDATNLTPTSRDTNGLGSTERAQSTPDVNDIAQEYNPASDHVHIIPFDIEDDLLPPSTVSPHQPSTNDDIAIIRNLTTDIEPPFHICLSSNPFDDVLTIDVSTRGDHPTLGFELDDNEYIGQRLQLMNCATSTPAARIPRWRSTLRNSFPLSIGKTKI